MNIFGVGGPEIIIIFIIMLIVAGPQRMIRWAYILGVYMGKFRKMWGEVVDVLQKEVNAAGLDVTLPKDLPTRQNVTRMVSDFAKPYTEEISREIDKVNKPIEESLAAADKLFKEEQESLERLRKKKQAGEDTAPVAAKAGDQESSSVVPDTGSFGAWANPAAPPLSKSADEVEKQ